MTKAPAVISPHNATTECPAAREQPHSLQLRKTGLSNKDLVQPKKNFLTLASWPIEIISH